MKTSIIGDDLKDWPLEIPDARVVTTRDYLTNPEFALLKGIKVFNLSRAYSYQSMGYYVSLLAAARGQKALPGVSTLVDLKMPMIIRIAGEEIEELINHALKPLQSNEFTLSIYFGQNMAKRYERLSAKLFRLFPAPLMRCHFVRDDEGSWRLKQLAPIPPAEVPESHYPLMLEYAKEFLTKRSLPAKDELGEGRFHLGILHNPEEENPPSYLNTLKRFRKAALSLDFSVELITREDFGRLAEFDALFIRETTNVNHHTFRMARRALAEGLVVIDDPDSILRCSNKVFLTELLERGKVSTPKTMIVHKENVRDVVANVGLPCILKQPDSAFSRGVIKVETEDELKQEAKRLLEKSDLVLAQQFLPTAFDWRVGVLNNEPLYACRYHMAKEHWQIVKRDTKGDEDWGDTETLPIWQVPPAVIKIALQATSLIGDGLYGVDIKERDGNVYVMEVNDNPDIHVGCEDAELKDELYQKIMQEFLRRVEKKRGVKGS